VGDHLEGTEALSANVLQTITRKLSDCWLLIVCRYSRKCQAGAPRRVAI
jgi:hypothetical protein